MQSNKKRIQLWINALLSGEFTQITGQLAIKKNDNGEKIKGRCCLGVACDVYARVTKNKGWDKDGASNYQTFYGEGDAMPQEVADWFGLAETNPYLIVNKKTKKQYSASELNDDKGYSFKKIAEVLEKNYLK